MTKNTSQKIVIFFNKYHVLIKFHRKYTFRIFWLIHLGLKHMQLTNKVIEKLQFNFSKLII